MHIVTGVVMMSVRNPVQHRVPHVDIRRGHVDFGAEHLLAVLEFALAHPLEQVEIFLHAAVPVRAFFAGLGERAAGFADLLGRQVAYIRLALTDQQDGAIVHFFEKIGGEKQLLPVKAEPLYIFFDRFDILRIFLQRIRIVKAQMRPAAEFVRQLEIQADRFGVSDMQIAVGLRRKPGHDFFYSPRL